MYRVFLEPSIAFSRDETHVYIGKRDAHGFSVALPMMMAWSVPVENGTAAITSEKTNPTLILPNELGETLRDALNHRYGAPPPPIDYQKLYEDCREQRDHWKALFQSMAANGEIEVPE